MTLKIRLMLQVARNPTPIYYYKPRIWLTLKKLRLSCFACTHHIWSLRDICYVPTKHNPTSLFCGMSAFYKMLQSA